MTVATFIQWESKTKGKGNPLEESQHLQKISENMAERKTQQCVYIYTYNVYFFYYNCFEGRIPPSKTSWNMTISTYNYFWG